MNQFSDGAFRLGVGIEDTFIAHTALGRRKLDEYELTQHYTRWAGDLDLVKASGAQTIRYGLPWYRINPSPGTFVWSWADRVVDRLCELGLEVIVDLVHYGTPEWLDNHFINHRYPQAVAEYAFALAERYGDRLTAWTPLNEPQWTARLCGESGTWPPYLTGDDGYLQLMRAIAKGVVGSQRAITDATGGNATFVHVEASFRYPSGDSGVLNERRWLCGDLLNGMVGDGHPLLGYLREHGFTDDDLTWFAENPAVPDVMGINYYPMWSTLVHEDGTGRERDDGVAGLEELVRETAARYGVPVMVTETSYEGTMAQRIAWLRDSVALLHKLRSEVEIAGYIWWPFFDQIRWQYREALDPVEHHLHRLGLVTLDADDVGGFPRRPNELFDVFQALCQGRQP
ncbi:family 1 glycosylhydrolase [Dactylosporangium sp. NPDC049525]|uniref:family 1 glycosylhydrolase n=1 Tax=Dactylosporangium sp. NPDC049525 TaxID=3154730 RepID=UPI00343A5717